MSQIQEMIKPAAAMLDTYPVVTTKQKIKQWIKTCVPGMTPEKAERYSWPQALLAMGLLQAYEQTKDKTALSSVFSYLRRWKNSGYPIAHVDHVMNGSVALWTEEILTREKREDAESLEALWICREGADICAGWIKAAKKTADGILAYRSQHPDWLFADTLGMLCPFACRYGVQKQDKELLNLGIRQLELFFQKGMDEKTGLPYHGYDEKTGMKYGIIGWGLQEQNRRTSCRQSSQQLVRPPGLLPGRAAIVCFYCSNSSLTAFLHGSAQTVDFPGSCRHRRDIGIPQQRG